MLCWLLLRRKSGKRVQSRAYQFFMFFFVFHRHVVMVVVEKKINGKVVEKKPFKHKSFNCVNNLQKSFQSDEIKAFLATF